MNIIAGIDPGYDGAICIMNAETKEIIDIFDMPTLTVERTGKTKSGKKKKPGKVLDGGAIGIVLNNQYKKLFLVEHVFIEKAQVMPKQGTVSGGNYMKAAGIIEGICIGLSIPYTLIRPNVWKKAMMLGMTKGKEGSIVRVQQLYPSLKFTRKKDHGRADAILIALYGLSI